MKAATPRTRRVVIKSRIVKIARGGAESIRTHLRYIAREGVTPRGERGQPYSKDADAADAESFADRCAADRHQFRFIVSPEDAVELGDLSTYTRQVMGQMEQDLETPLDWVAVNHWDTDNPHVHIVLRGKGADGRDLLIDRDYVSHGMRTRAAEVATDWLGLRTDRDVAVTMKREVAAERWTPLDVTLQAGERSGVVNLKQWNEGAGVTRSALIGRLATLERLGLAERHGNDAWRLSPDLESTLRALGERGDMLKALHRAVKGRARELSLPGRTREAFIQGQVIGRGFVDELHDRGYLIVDATDGRAHYVPLSPQVQGGEFPIGGLVQVRLAPEPRSVDRRIAALASDQVYRTETHRLSLLHTRPADEIASLLEAHTRRLEALRRAGIVERLSDGVWQIPSDLVARGRAYDEREFKHPAVTLRSPLTLRQQQRAIGATWLDEQLVRQALPGQAGFGAEVRGSLAERESFLVESGLAERRAGRILLTRDLLTQLRTREIESVAARLSAQSGLTYRPLDDGTPVSGSYRRSLQLVSGRFAMLDDGVGFSLVPWRPVIEKRLGQSITAVARGDRISWYFGRQRGLER
jgi:type IV secretory pathway VirD2 relaxase